MPPAFMGFAGQISGLQLRDRYRAHSATITLIARRSRQRAGTRQWRRGADLEAAVANFVESEQLVVVDGGVVQSSFVQVGAGWECWMGLGEARWWWRTTDWCSHRASVARRAAHMKLGGRTWRCSRSVGGCPGHCICCPSSHLCT